MFTSIHERSSVYMIVFDSHVYFFSILAGEGFTVKKGFTKAKTVIPLGGSRTGILNGDRTVSAWG